MTDDTSKPKRWRWIIAGVLLFAVSALGWWYWPRGDERFVGKWSITTMGRDDNATMTLYRHGRGVSATSTASVPFSWRVEGTRLVMGTKSNVVSRFLNGAYSAVVPAPAPPLVLEEDVLGIELTDDPSTILLHIKGLTLTLTRIPE